MSDKAFRNALGKFATGVCLISVNDERSCALALTANSFSSVSLDPPLVLWSIQNNSECFREYTDCLYFGISVLSSSQEHLSNRYAQKGCHGIDQSDFMTDPTGTPLLRNALAQFSCKRHKVIDGGDHQIVIGEVIGYATEDRDPLLFHAGSYDRLKSSAA